MSTKTTDKNKKITKTKKVPKKEEPKVAYDNSDFKKKSRRIFILILLLFLLILILGSSTFAWFSSNKHATIESIDINVATINGLQISTDAINWGNDITKEQLIDAYKTYPASRNQLPDSMSNVSTAGGVTNGDLDLYYGITSEAKKGGFTLTTLKQTEERCTGDEECKYSKHYIAFDVFLLTTTPATIGITGNSNVIPQPDTPDRGAQNAARIGFVIEGSVGPKESNLAQSLKGGRRSYIWEPNYDVHTERGIAAAKKTYGISTSKTGGSRLPYKGVNSEFHTPIYIDQTDKSSHFSSVNPDAATIQGFEMSQTLFTIPAGISKIRVYMWLEGQDVDMENGISSSALLYNLEFTMLN